MEIYLVGGAVRDQLLGLPVQDKDYVVVGASTQQMLDAGYRLVGRDFPVFLHPQTHQEYALARTERKTGYGYQGFVCYSAQDVTLEQDLLRRDLTINAIAQNEQGEFFDPFHGRDDLTKRLLRHVSPAFSEDPLRVLRVARFAARYAHLNFTVAPETMVLMQQISASGELRFLAAERVWQETQRVLACRNPQVYFQVLQHCGALAVLFPELAALFGVPAPEKWHPEIDSGVHTLMALAMATALTDAPQVRFATLCHDFGKGLTPRHYWPHHYGHGPAGVSLVVQFCQRLRVPKELCDFACLVARYHDDIHRVNQLRPATLIKLFNALDAWRKPTRIADLALVCEADARGRLGFTGCPWPQRQWLLQAWQVAQSVSPKAVVAAGFRGSAVRDELYRLRVVALTAWKASWNGDDAQSPHPQSPPGQ